MATDETSSGEVILYIDISNSSCSACDEKADPFEFAHNMELMVGTGCGAVFTHSSSNYAGMAERVQEMRPDLIWVGLDF